ncbi:MAG: hypothetical protein B7X90_07685 [Novosphingobium sp. 17-62-19]|uniref:sensor histidine kinase n=1 Tax=Novosphingobium sp. 17-62-19 TaxID=1970406 RepID=UPI000BCC74D4|nr:histidine kinase dimerization/phospho-acceptor domain-containing protein [Novosphingobium sp. 17-62-19]OZA19843.1 MAG: hypothetical protein B7X90_07685 [Novosphingobium sp. 17-62-19]
MIVDDRLETVLRTHVASKTAAKTQLRQLVDLLGTVPLSAWSARHATALQRVDSLAGMLSDEECAAVLRVVPHRSAVLVYHFAQGGPRTASAAVSAARLSTEDWLALIPRLPTTTRGFVRHRSDLGEPVRELLSRLGVDDFLLPEPARKEAAVTTAPTSNATPVAPFAPFALPEPVAPSPESVTVPFEEPAPQPATEVAPAILPTGFHSDAEDGIGAIVRRIEAFRRKRKERDDAATSDKPGQPHPDGIAPRLPFAEEDTPARPAPLSIDLRTDANGTVTSAGIDPPGMLVGTHPFCANTVAPVHCDADMERAFRHRQPIRAGQLHIEGAPAVAGHWQADGTPLFAPDGGRFTGYLLRLRRPLTLGAAPAVAPTAPASNEADRLRQLLHELRTPINAIQGFAEMIQSQALGSTPHQYRAMAASIASDAAQILAGFEEVERLVKLESHALTLEPGEADASAIVARMVEQLLPVLNTRNVRLAVAISPTPLPVAMAAEELERSVWRVLSVIAASVAPGERLTIALDSKTDSVLLTIALPAALYRLDDTALFAPDVAGSTGSFTAPAMLGNGFALRLARAEFEAATGTLVREGERLLIALPHPAPSAPASAAQA